AAVAAPGKAPARARALPPMPKPLMITESKPYSADRVIEEEIAKMEELGDEMHEEIRRKTKK
ncbi:MAG: hypothetical protein COV48_09455, partial [Elusimicrobia bacterium CG11_big_fil_rev_8_21_14_0_20_64_6]